MTWSLGYLPPRQPELLDALFLAAGRSLHLANAFEEKCRWMVRCINLVEMHESDVEIVMDDDGMITNLPVDKMLAATLNRLTGKVSTSDEIMDSLRRATKARNFIAHEGASVGHISVVRERHVLAHVRRLRSAVLDLIDGWVFGHFGDLLDEEAVDPAATKL